MKVSSLLILFPCLIIFFTGCSKQDKPELDRAILIIIDTFRADEMEVYGGNPVITPNLNKMASDGVVFDRAWSQSPWTLTSIGTILSGLYPNEHGAIKSGNDLLALNENVETLAERLRSKGFTTVAWMNNQFGQPQYGLDQGFEYFSHAAGQMNSRIRNASMTLPLVTQWLDDHGDKNFFMVLHLFDPHLKYEAPEKFRNSFITDKNYSGPLSATFGIEEDLWNVRLGRMVINDEDRKHLRQLYDAESAFVDAEIGRLMDYLNEKQWMQSTLIVVTADHGEEFWDHGSFEHGHSFYDELIRVPMVFFSKGAIPAGEIVSGNVAHLDIAPTILEALGESAYEDISGQSVWNSWESSRIIDADREIISSWPMWGEQKSAYIKGDKKIIFPHTGRPFMFSINEDIDESNPLPLSGQKGLELYETANATMKKLAERTAAHTQKTPVGLTEKQRRDLESQGYLR